MIIMIFFHCDILGLVSIHDILSLNSNKEIIYNISKNEIFNKLEKIKFSSMDANFKFLLLNYLISI